MTAPRPIMPVLLSDPDVEFNLDAYRDYVTGFRMCGLNEAADFIDRIIAEVKRLDALLTKIGDHSDQISDSIVHYREHRRDRSR
jgi:hypothetical protein